MRRDLVAGRIGEYLCGRRSGIDSDDRQETTCRVEVALLGHTSIGTVTTDIDESLQR